MKAILIVVGLAGVTLGAASESHAADLAIIQLKARDGVVDVGSSALAGGVVSTPNTGYGRGVSPDVYWANGVPTNPRSWVVMFEDADAVVDGAPRLQWARFNIPPIVQQIPLDEAWDTEPPGVKAGANSAGGTDYLPPKPTGPATHHYHLEVFALDAVLPLAEGASRQDLIRAMSGHVIASGETVASFRAP